MHLQTVLCGNHPNDSLIMKVIDQMMGVCIKITWCKNHDNNIFSVNAKIHPQLIFCMVATLMVHCRIMKIHKNHSGNIPNIFP